MVKSRSTAIFLVSIEFLPMLTRALSLAEPPFPPKLMFSAGGEGAAEVTLLQVRKLVSDLSGYVPKKLEDRILGIMYLEKALSGLLLLRPP